MTMLRAFLSFMLVASTSAVYNIQGRLVCNNIHQSDNDKEKIAADDAVDDVWVELYYMERDTLQTYCTPFSVGGHNATDKYHVSDSRGLRCINDCILYDTSTGTAIRGVTFFHEDDSGCYCTKTTKDDTNAEMSTCSFEYTNDYLELQRAKHDSRVSRNGLQMISLDNYDNFIHLEGAAGRTDDASLLMVKVTNSKCDKGYPEEKILVTDMDATTLTRFEGVEVLPSTIEMGSSTLGSYIQPIVYCKDGVTGFRLRVESDTARDDSGLNGIKLRCMNGRGEEIDGYWGDWKGWRLCNHETYVISFQLRGEGDEASDKTGANNVRMKCSDGKVIDGGGYAWGVLEPYKSCPGESYFCGVQAKMQAPQGRSGDDTAINRLKFYCCKASPVSGDVDLGRVVPVGEITVKGLENALEISTHQMWVHTRADTGIWYICNTFWYNVHHPESILRCRKRIMARYLRIVTTSTVSATIKVTVTEAKLSVAFKKPAKQRDTVWAGTNSHDAGKAVDGIYDISTIHYGTHVATIYAETLTFWRVDLKELITIDKIYLYLEKDYYDSNDVLKVVTNKWNLATWTPCKIVEDIKEASSQDARITRGKNLGDKIFRKEVTCTESPTVARAVRINNGEENGKAIRLYEVEVLEANVVWFNTPHDCFDDTTPQFGCKDLLFDLYTGEVTKYSPYTGRQTHEEAEAEVQSDYSLFHTIELIPGEKELLQNALIKTVDVGKEYILKFQVKFTSNNFGRVVRFSVDDSHDETTLGDGAPTVDFSDGDFTVWTKLRADNGQITRMRNILTPFALREWITVEIRQLLEGGQYKQTILISDETHHATVTNINNQPTESKKVKVYASGSPAATGNIRQLTLSGKPDSLFSIIELVRCERMLVKNTLIKTVDVGKEYILKFQVKFTANRVGNVVRFSTSVDGDLGDGGPTIFFGDGVFTFHSYPNGDSLSFNARGYRLNQWITIEVRQLLEGGQYKLYHIVDGKTLDEVINHQPTDLKGVKVYASDFHYQAAIGKIRKLEFGKPVYYKLWNKMFNAPLYAGYDYHYNEERSSRGRHAKVKSRSDADYDDLISTSGDILIWKLEKVETIDDKDYYKIISIDTGGAIHSPDYQINYDERPERKTDHYAKVESRDDATRENDDQLWEIVKGHDAYYTIVSKKFGQPLFADREITRVADTGANNYQPTGKEIWDLQKL